MGMYTMLTCDNKTCEQKKLWDYVSKHHLITNARREGWLIGKSKHLCPACNPSHCSEKGDSENDDSGH